MTLKHHPKLALPVFLLLLLLSACRREESLESGFTSAYALQDTFGTCFGNQVVGTYHAGQELGDSNYLEIELYVAVPGRYSINTDVQNGFSFTGTGSFADTGMTSIRIPARGTPIAEGTTTFRIARDSSYCEIDVTVLGATPVNGGGTCNAQVSGSYQKDSALNGTHQVTLQHNFTTTGAFVVSTDTINGYWFMNTVNVTSVGSQAVTLPGSGTPAATGTNNFTVHFGDGASCGFPITVVAGSSGGGGSTGCGTLNGAYTVGTATTAANTFTSSSHAYAASGTYNVVVTPTAPGLNVSTVAVTAASAGSSPAISVQLSGTPTAAGTFPVNISFGDGTTCSVSMTVLPAGTTTSGDYFPLSAGSWWSYDEGTGDTLARRNTYSTTFGGQAYRGFIEYDGNNNPQDTFYYRKDASGITYQSISPEDALAGVGNITFTSGLRVDVPIVKDALTGGATWTSATFSGATPAGNTSFRVSFTCASVTPSMTINGHSFTNVYEVKSTIEWNPMGLGWQPVLSNFSKQYFAPGVGLIQEGTFSFNEIQLRNYQVQ